MTKKELIESLKDFNDSDKIYISDFTAIYDINSIEKSYVKGKRVITINSRSLQKNFQSLIEALANINTNNKKGSENNECK